MYFKQVVVGGSKPKTHYLNPENRKLHHNTRNRCNTITNTTQNRSANNSTIPDYNHKVYIFKVLHVKVRMINNMYILVE